MAYAEDVDIRDINLGDIVRLHYRVACSNNLAKPIGLVTKLDSDEIILATYDPDAEKPTISDEIPYRTKDIERYDIIEKNKPKINKT